MSTEKPIWSRKTPEETQKLYADWADSYEADVAAWGYATPSRVAAALKAHLPSGDVPILDFGCGTGLSGKALAEAGFQIIDGTDVSPEMIARVNDEEIYRQTWLGQVGKLDVQPGDYTAIAATGVISLGAAQPDTLGLVLSKLDRGGLLAMSYNDATLLEPDFMQALCDVQLAGTARLIWAEYGDHLPAKEINSTVYIIEKT